MSRHQLLDAIPLLTSNATRTKRRWRFAVGYNHPADQFYRRIFVL